MIHKLCVIEPLLIPHETSGAIALELTSKFVTFEITSASQIIIEISWHVRDTITIPWSSVCLAQICRAWRAWPMSKSIILFESSNYKLWFRILSMSAEPCPSCNIHVHLAIHRLHRGNYSKDLPDSRTGIAFWNVIWPEVTPEVVNDLPVLIALNEFVTWSLIGQMGWQV